MRRRKLVCLCVKICNLCVCVCVCVLSLRRPQTSESLCKDAIHTYHIIDMQPLVALQSMGLLLARNSVCE